LAANLIGTLNGLPDSKPGDYRAEIDWEGNGQFEPADIVKTASGSLVVKGSHVYDQQGTYDVLVIAVGPGGSTDAEETAKVIVTDMPSGIPGTPPDPQPALLPPSDVTVSLGGFYQFTSFAGVGFQENVIANVAGTLNGRLDNKPGDYVARVNWGDSDQWDDADIVKNSSGSLLVKGTHTYAQQDEYPVVVYVNGPDGTSASEYTAKVIVTDMPSGIPGTQPDGRTSLLPPSDVSLSLGGFYQLSLFAGVAFQQKTVANLSGFLNGQPDKTVGDYRAQINWGDSDAWDEGDLVPANGSILVNGSHVYRTQGTYPIVVYVNGPDETSKAEYTAKAIVGPAR
jgi:PKD repeat protein